MEGAVGEREAPDVDVDEEAAEDFEPGVEAAVWGDGEQRLCRDGS